MPLIITPRQFTQRAELFHQLAQFTSAGIPIVQALEQNQTQSARRFIPRALQRLLDELVKGATLAESLQSLNWLPAFDLALIGAGEQSGRLDICFRLLADYYNDRARVIKQVISQLIYPVGLIHLAALIFFNRASFCPVTVQRQPDSPVGQGRTHPFTALWRRRPADFRHARQTR